MHQLYSNCNRRVGIVCFPEEEEQKEMKRAALKQGTPEAVRKGRQEKREKERELCGVGKSKETVQKSKPEVEEMRAKRRLLYTLLCIFSENVPQN